MVLTSQLSLGAPFPSLEHERLGRGPGGMIHEMNRENQVCEQPRWPVHHDQWPDIPLL